MTLKRKKIKEILGSSPRERRAVLSLIPLIAALVWIVWSAAKPRTDLSAMTVGDTLASSGVNSPNPGGMSETRKESTEGISPDQTELFSFDPNTVTYEQLRRLGIAKNTAAGIVKYRERGKVFQIPEDFATCYGVTDSAYAVLRPYISIGDEFRLKKPSSANYTSGGRAGSSDKAVDPASGKESTGSAFRANGHTDMQTGRETLETFDPNSYSAEEFTSLGFSPRQAQTIVKYRESIGGFRTPEDLARCYVVSGEVFAELEPFISIRPQENDHASATEKQLVELNTADSVQLVALRGIGPRTASELIRYRSELGGFHSAGQLAELKVVNEKNYEIILPQICVDSCEIQKIDINFASPNAVAQHPYMAGKLARRILKHRQLKGGWSTIEDMMEDNTLSAEQAAKLAPYLHFTVPDSK